MVSLNATADFQGRVQMKTSCPRAGPRLGHACGQIVFIAHGSGPPSTAFKNHLKQPPCALVTGGPSSEAAQPPTPTLVVGDDRARASSGCFCKDDLLGGFSPDPNRVALADPLAGLWPVGVPTLTPPRLGSGQARPKRACLTNT